MRKLYHVSPVTNRESILRYGIRIGSWLIGYRGLKWAVNHLSDQKGIKTGMFDVYVVMVRGSDIVSAGGKPDGKYITRRLLCGCLVKDFIHERGW